MLFRSLALVLALSQTTGCAALFEPSQAAEIRIERGALTVDGDASITGSIFIGQGARLSLAGPVNGGVYAQQIVNEGTLEFSSREQSLLGGLEGSGVLHIAAPTRLTVGAANGFSGKIEIDRGATLRLTGSIGCGDYRGTIVNDGTLAFANHGRQVIAGAIQGAGDLLLEAGELVLGNPSDPSEAHPCEWSPAAGWVYAPEVPGAAKNTIAAR